MLATGLFPVRMLPRLHPSHDARSTLRLHAAGPPSGPPDVSPTHSTLTPLFFGSGAAGRLQI
eukprot:352143-Chlamydomonas_euryale.AAC.2